jgi:hypothetical protein
VSLQLVRHQEARRPRANAHDADMALSMDGPPSTVLGICLWARSSRYQKVRHSMWVSIANETSSDTKEREDKDQCSSVATRAHSCTILYSNRTPAQLWSQSAPLCIPQSSQCACACRRTQARVELNSGVGCFESARCTRRGGSYSCRVGNALATGWGD